MNSWVLAYAGIGALIWLGTMYQLVRSLFSQLRLSQEYAGIPAPVWTRNKVPDSALEELVASGHPVAKSLVQSGKAARLGWYLILAWWACAFFTMAIIFMVGFFGP